MTTDAQNCKATATSATHSTLHTHATLHWPKAAASIAVVRGNTVLLVERSKPPRAGLWSLPGGHIEPGETAAAAALRELAEETGVSAELVSLVDILDIITHDEQGILSVHYLLAVFCGRWISGEPVAASDSRSARFVQIDGLAAYRLTPGAETMIKRAEALIPSCIQPVMLDR